MKQFKKYKMLLVLLPMVIFTVAISLIGTETLVETIGIQNSYIFMFVIACIGGLSLFSGVPYPMILVTLALGGGDVVYLAIATTLGVMLGDSTSYFLGGKANHFIEGTPKKIFDTILSVYDNYPKYMTFFFFIYGICSPFPNDMITLSSGMKQYGFRKTMLPLTAGNLIFCLTLAGFAEYFAQYL